MDKNAQKSAPRTTRGAFLCAKHQKSLWLLL
nr:MAG TPA: hypothetical protein [Caudoviricetes sp.]